jgi:hypothetical protein
MLITKKSTRKKGSYFAIFSKFYSYLSLILLACILLLLFNTGYLNKYKIAFLKRFYKSSVNYYIDIFPIGFNALKGAFYTFPELNINISFKNVIKLENNRKNLLKQERGYTFGFLEVPSKIKYKNKSYNADLRLKGDRLIHYEERKYSSYKIDLKREGRIFNVKKFSLMKPRARNYIHEWIFHELAGEGELVKLKYKFVDLKINGKNQGLYVFEEGFGKILLERNKRRNGPIFSLHEEFSDDTDIKNIKFEVYNKKYWLNPENIKLSKIASQKLRDLFEDKKRIDEILDVDKWAWYFAVADINDYFHGLFVKSVKFYYNPVNGKFEPVAFDGHRKIAGNYNRYEYNWNKLLWGFPSFGPSSFEKAKSCKILSDNNIKDIHEKSENYNRCSRFVYKFFYNSKDEINVDFYNKYRNAVLKIASKNFLDTFFKTRENQIKKINSEIYGDYFLADHDHYYGPDLYYFNKKDFYHKANILLQLIENKPNKVFIQQDRQNIIVQNESINNNNLVIKQLHCNKNFNSEQEEIILNVDYNLVYKNNKINLTNYTNANIVCKKAIIIDKNDNNKISKFIDTLNTYRKINYKDSYLNRYNKYFVLNDNFIELKKNYTLIDEDIYIPKDLIVKIFPGQKIILTNNAFIFSDSPWLVGGKKERVFISGKKDNFGGGVLISKTNLISKFTNTSFSYLNGVNKNINHLAEQYILLGAININQSEIIFEDVEFKAINAEDALNIINSKFKILNSNYKDISSDAIDIDFGIGEILNSNFANIKNDAIDFSGSKAKLSNIEFTHIGDKLVSVGENSIVNINDIVGKDSFVGFASKDGSTLKGNKINFNNVNIPFASYIKKSEYDKAILKVNGARYQNYLIPYLRDQHSLIEINNDNKKNINKEVVEIIYNKNIAALQKN